MTALAVGDTLGPYEILALLGEGGMGRVYRARDPRLGRDVAIKTSATQFDQRFQHEARAIAALNHPNICTLHDVGPDYLVMELVEGASPRGPIRLEEALRIAGQIAAAMGAAHERGIVHRDLKPANIKIRPDGTVKVLDFGLAKVRPHAMSDESTSTVTRTVEGTVIGTPAYMAPEQAQGQEVDARADVWAFGVVLYELLTDERAFKGDSFQATLAAVLTAEPDLSRVPPRVRRLLRACLKKARDERLAHIGNWRLLLDEEAEGDVSQGRRSTRWAAAVGVLGILAVAGVAYSWLPSGAVNTSLEQLVRLHVPIPGGNGASVTFAVSPDGKSLAIAADQAGVRHLWVHTFDALDPRLLPGTEGAVNPFWSPAGNEIGFSADGKLKKVSLTGQVSTLANRVGVGSWHSRSGILLSGDGIWRLDPASGNVVDVLRPQGQEAFSDAQFLPDGNHYLYTHYLGAQPGIHVASIDGTINKRVLPDPTKPQFVRLRPGSTEGAILFRRAGVLMAQRFDLSSLAVEGPAVALVDGPVASKDDWGPSALFAASETGVLAYQTTPLEQLVWMNRNGTVAGAFGAPGEFQGFRLAPDGGRVASRIDRYSDARSSADVAIRDMRTGTLERLTFDGGPDLIPVWSPDGTRLAFASMRSGTWEPFVTDGAGKEKQLADMPSPGGWPLDWSPDGRFLLWQGGADLWIVPLEAPSEPRTVVASEFTEIEGSFSRDGKWLAYVSDESGRFELYVRGMPEGPRYTVSAEGGRAPAWRADGKELFYQGLDGILKVLPVTTGTGSLSFGRAETLFAVPMPLFHRRYELAKDGQRILVPTGAASITAILNWPRLMEQ